MKTVFGSLVALITGIWMNAHYAAQARVCSTHVGQFVQALSPQTQADCSVATSAHRAAPWLIGLGILGLVGAIGFLLFGATVLQKAEQQKRERDGAP